MVTTKVKGLNLTSKNDILYQNRCRSMLRCCHRSRQVKSCRSISAGSRRSIFLAIVYSDVFFFMTCKNLKTNISSKLMKTN
ncbi:hypothetical protein YC2023_033440 [Brassica napus]